MLFLSHLQKGRLGWLIRSHLVGASHSWTNFFKPNMLQTKESNVTKCYLKQSRVQPSSKCISRLFQAANHSSEIKQWSEISHCSRQHTFCLILQRKGINGNIPWARSCQGVPQNHSSRKRKKFMGWDLRTEANQAHLAPQAHQYLAALLPPTLFSIIFITWNE